MKKTLQHGYNPSMRKVITCTLLVISLMACNPKPAPGTPSATASPRPSPTVTASPTPTPIRPASSVSLPTPTPVIHVIQGNDTLTGIATKYGISVEELQAANPGVNPLFLQVGTELVIPMAGFIAANPTITPEPVLIRRLNCFRTANEGAWCLASVTNDFPEPLENLSAWIALKDQDGNEIAAQQAFAPINVLPPGESLPMAAYFPPPLPGEIRPEAQLLSAIRILPQDARYVPAAIQNSLVEVDWNAKTAQVSGQFTLTLADTQATQTWILAVAYDSDGNIIGFRRWEHYNLLTTGERREFSFSVYSLGPEIDSVKFLIECRP